MITNLLQLLKSRFVGFSVVGLGVMVGGIAFLYILVDFCRVDQNIAYLLQAFASIESSFVLNRWLNWRDRTGSLWAQLVKFNVTKIGIVALNQLLFALLVAHGVHYLLVAIIGVAIATIINYFMNDRFVFGAQTSLYTEYISMEPLQDTSLILNQSRSSSYQNSSPLVESSKRA